MTGKYEAEAVDKLLAACAETTAVYKAAKAFDRFTAPPNRDDDLVAGMQYAAQLILAAEALRDAAAAVVQQARAALAEAMFDSGCTAFRLPSHTVSAAEGPPKVFITGDVPSEFLTTKPDMAKTTKALRAGERLTWAHLGNERSRFVQFRSRDK